MQSMAAGIQHRTKMMKTEISILVTLVVDCDVMFAEKPDNWTRLRKRKIILVYRYPMMHMGNTELANVQASECPRSIA